MSLATPEKIRRLQSKLYVKAKGDERRRFLGGEPGSSADRRRCRACMR